MSPDLFHPAVARWFERTFDAPTDAQREGWPAIRAGRHTLIAAPTGSGKTLSAFLCAIDDLVRLGLEGGTGLPAETRVLYVSPLKALGNDIEKNLRAPLEGIGESLRVMGLPEVAVRTAVRSGDTPAAERARTTNRPPHIFVTTPESLYILLTSAGGRRMLRTVRTVIVDEIHALVRDKRGSHLALSLERLEALTGGNLRRIGLSATQRPIEEVARYLVGAAQVDAAGRPDCVIVDRGHRRKLDLELVLPASPLEPVMSNEVWEEVYDQLAALVREHRTTLVFVNTRRLAERLARHLSERLGEDRVTAHHGSMSREHRLDAEQRLKGGSLDALVATASLELGIDIGDVELVCQLGSPRSIAALLQRVGRSGHHLGGVPKGRLFPLSRDELVECTALLDAVRRGELDRIHIPQKPLDILAQQLVAHVAGEEEATADDVYSLVTRAWPYRTLERGTFDQVVRMVAEGFRTGRGRRGGWLHHDQVHGKVRPRRGARLAAITSGGAIPDMADYDVVLEPAGLRVGTVNEDFAIESLPGNIFQLGNHSYKILRVQPGTVRVEDAHGQPPNIPFWLGEAPGRSDELSWAVSRLREEVARRLHAAGDAAAGAAGDAEAWLAGEVGAGLAAAEQLVEYLDTTRAALGALPTQSTVVLERFFDEAGAMHLVLHAPFGSRLNRAWGLALRKRFCRSFNVELQAAATDDAIVLSLGPTHSFPLEDVMGFLRSATLRDVLIQALLDAPMFETRWRWNATRALAVLRFRGGRRVPPQLQRMEADDLKALVFPDQVACLENVAGDRDVPDHPLVSATIRDCLEEGMDAAGLEAVLRRLEDGELTVIARDLAEPSPLSHEILNARPYAFLDDAPLEERRTQAVHSRRWLAPEDAARLGALDADVIARVQGEAWPEARSADELHDALVLHAAITEEEGRSAGWGGLFDALADARRAARLRMGERTLWIAAERTVEWQAVAETVTVEPTLAPPPGTVRAWAREDALREILRGRLDALGPVTCEELAAPLGLDVQDAAAAVAALEAEGAIFRGRFRPGAEGEEWCERRLLARIHRGTLERLRGEIEPVTAQVFMRFLLAWQHADPEARMEGPGGLEAVLERLEGFEGAAAAWESDILPVRMKEYDPAWLDALCLAGRIAWARRTPAAVREGTQAAGPIRSTPVALVRRDALGVWLGASDDGPLSSDAERVWGELETRGASFFGDLVAGSGLVRARVEDALAELVSRGRVSSDGFSGLRALLVPSSRRRPARTGRRRGRVAVFGMESAGRWSGLPRTRADLLEGDVETVAWALLQRWGVIFRRLIDREGALPPWRDLLRVYRRLEARGEIRGGRFVAGFAGEQYALPGAVSSLRRIRRAPPKGHLVSVSAADPLNLLGILTPGPRVASVPTNRILYRDGVPVAVKSGRDVQLLEDAPQPERWQLEAALTRRQVPVQVRAYLGTHA